MLSNFTLKIIQKSINQLMNTQLKEKRKKKKKEDHLFSS